jgi:hypothetical protein
LTNASIAVRLTSGDGKTATGTLSQKANTPATARRTAWRAAGGILLVGLAALPIPIVHFIVPPASLLFAPLIWVLVFKIFKSGTDVSGPLTCPACGQPTQISLGWPTRGGTTELAPTATTNCSACMASLTLTRV